jgi:hypothetical protein
VTSGPDVQDDYLLPLDAFVRAIGINRAARHALFLGAGASITSGVPSADTCIWQWKGRLFLTNNPGLERQFEDLSLPSVRTAIQQWLAARGGFPPSDAPDEYGFYAERAYPIAQDRRQYFQGLAEQARPFVGYELLCLLAKADLFTTVWTTNFDGLVPRAGAAADITVVEIGLDTADRVARQPRKGELIHIAIHGDYRYDALKNTPPELQDQDSRLRKALVRNLADTSLVVIGYSGRDESVMDALTEGYAQLGTGRLYWCSREGAEPRGAVRDLITVARANGREAFFIPITGFDDLMGRLALHCLEGQERARADELRSKLVKLTDSPPFHVGAGPTGSIIKSNAFPATLPSEVLQIDASLFTSVGGWRRLKDRTADSPVVAALMCGKVLALGTLDGIRQVFCDDIESDVRRVPLVESDFRYGDGIIISLFVQALVRSLAASAELETDGRDLIWLTKSRERRKVLGTEYDVHEAVVVALRRFAGRSYLVVKPTIASFGFDGCEAPEGADRELKRLILTRQYNKEFSNTINAWRKRLFGRASTFEFPPRSGSGFRFTIRKNPVFASVASSGQGRSIPVPASIQADVEFRGVQRPEPGLLFSSGQGETLVTDRHPLRGLTDNRPYDYALTSGGLKREIRLGVVCPSASSARLTEFLNSLHTKTEPTSRAPYLITYPGFAQALGLPLEVPKFGTPAWADCQEPVDIADVRQGAQELARRVTASIEMLQASASPNVVVVYVPTHWQAWEHYEDDLERFDLHDYVKAFCVQRGIATQFLREATLIKQHQCEVQWWLALSLYVKSLRTPWILDRLDRETAFLGLGFSLDRTAPRGSHVVQGCSHIYNSDGLGLRYRLAKLETSQLDRHGNPFLSRDDARRMGENVRQLFYDSLGKLPSRVVIHKRTRFRDDEREGLLEGLHGVSSVDMLEVNIEGLVRFVASKCTLNGALEADLFPVSRGTAVVMDANRALVWVHGTSQVVDPQLRYYLGKSRIPAPLLVTRHHGRSDLDMLVDEVLGLSKMNWNSFDLYTRGPATIDSSNKIAEIGALLERTAPQSYDYRLFV